MKHGSSCLALAFFIAGLSPSVASGAPVREGTPWVPGEIVVALKPLASSADLIDEATGRLPLSVTPLWSDPTAKWLNDSRSPSRRSRRGALPLEKIYVLRYEAAIDPISEAKQLQSLPSVAYASPNFVLKVPVDEQPIRSSEESPNDFLSPLHLEPQLESSGVGSAPLPLNYGVATSLQSWLNANALNIFPVHNHIRDYTGGGPGEGWWRSSPTGKRVLTSWSTLVFPAVFLRWVRLERLRRSPLLTDGTPAGCPRRWISPRLNHVVRFVSLLVLHQA